jgi:hypothetical protein
MTFFIKSSLIQNLRIWKTTLKAKTVPSRSRRNATLVYAIEHDDRAPDELHFGRLKMIATTRRMLGVAQHADNSSFLLRVSDSCAIRIATLGET